MVYHRLAMTDVHPPSRVARPDLSKAELQERIERERSAVLLVNTHSRRGRYLFEEAYHLLRRHGYTVIEAYTIRDRDGIGESIDRAVAHKAPLLVVGSGDGTVSTVVGHLAYTDTALGLLPFGTTNNFARNMGLPFSLEQAIQVITRGKVVDIDLGKVNDHYFANVASMGLSVSVAQTVSQRLKRTIGRPAYGVAGARAFVGHQPFRATVHTPDARHEFLTHQLVAANGGYHGGRVIAHGASVEDRELTIFPLGDHRKSRLLAGLTTYAYGRRRHVTEGPFICTPEAIIETEPVQDVEVDGEVFMASPVRVNVARQALRVIAPRDYVDL